MRRVVVPVFGTEVAPRFDLAPEVWIGLQGPSGAFVEERTVVLPQPSAENLCQLILSEGAHVLVCGGIEQEYYDYLVWKKVTVFDGVIATIPSVKKALEEGTLTSGAILMERHGER
uniref:Dinitrogenase iron-molybdenum cofactor biosynthesis protein n=1 Tax=Desulfacinum infernum TaxID=35837 RepID=A0A831ZIT1_9BACT